MARWKSDPWQPNGRQKTVTSLKTWLVSRREIRFFFFLNYYLLRRDHFIKASQCVQIRGRYEGNQVVIPASPLLARVDLVDLKAMLTGPCQDHVQSLAEWRREAESSEHVGGEDSEAFGKIGNRRLTSRAFMRWVSLQCCFFKHSSLLSRLNVPCSKCQRPGMWRVLDSSGICMYIMNLGVRSKSKQGASVPHTTFFTYPEGNLMRGSQCFWVLTTPGWYQIWKISLALCFGFESF